MNTTPTAQATPPNQPEEPPRIDIQAVGGPVWMAWREGTLTRAKELEALANWVRCRNPKEHDEILAEAIHCHLKAARDAATVKPLDPRRRLGRFRNGSLMERASSNLDAAEAHILNIAPADYVLGQMPCLLRHMQSHLPATDPGRQNFEQIARSVGVNDRDRPANRNHAATRLAGRRADKKMDNELRDKKRTIDNERGEIVTTVRAASSAALREQLRLRSFRNVVVVTAALMTLLAIGVALTGYRRPTLVPLCFTPEESGIATVVCPTAQSNPFWPIQAGTPPPDIDVPILDVDVVLAATAQSQDLLVVELVGLTAAAIATAAAIRRVKGSSERYGLPVALAALKLPTGAITAFLGLLLMRGQFVPGLSALDTAAQILAWALVFGYAQRLDIPRDRHRTVNAERFGDLTAVDTAVTALGVRRRAVLTHSSTLHAGQSRGLDQALDKARARLSDLQARLHRGNTRRPRAKVEADIATILKPRWVAQIITVTLTGEDPATFRLSYRTNTRARTRLEDRLFGKRILFTNRDHWSVADVVVAYRSQSDAEFGFRQLKDPQVVSFSPMHHWTDQKIRVHVFYCVLALATAHLMRRQAAHAGLHLSVRELLDHLAGIGETVLLHHDGGKGRPRAQRILTDMNDTQRRLFDLFGLDRYAPTR